MCRCRRCWSATRSTRWWPTPAPAVGTFGHGYTYSWPSAGLRGWRWKPCASTRDDNTIGHVQRVAPRLQAGHAAVCRAPAGGRGPRHRPDRRAGAGRRPEASRKPFDPKRGVGAYFVKRAQAHGLIVRVLGGDIIAFSPPLVITEAEIDELLGKTRPRRWTTRWPGCAAGSDGLRTGAQSMALIEIQPPLQDATPAARRRRSMIVSLDIEAGEFLTLLGPSGSGKTSTLMLLAGFEQPTGGPHPARWPADRAIAGTPARHGRGVPELQPVSAHDGGAERGLSRCRCADCRAATITTQVAAGAGDGAPGPPGRSTSSAAVGRPAAAGGAGAGAGVRAARGADGRAAVGTRQEAARRDAAGDPPPAPHAGCDHGVRHPRPGRGDGHCRTGWPCSTMAVWCSWPRRSSCTTRRPTCSWPASSATTTTWPARPTAAGGLPQTASGLQPAGPARGKLPAAGPATLCVRPEHLRPARDGDPLNRLDATVLDAIHLGDHWRLVFRVGSAGEQRRRRHLVRQAGPRRPSRRAGHRASRWRMAFDPQHAWLFASLSRHPFFNRGESDDDQDQ